MTDFAKEARDPFEADETPCVVMPNGTVWQIDTSPENIAVKVAQLRKDDCGGAGCWECAKKRYLAAMLEALSAKVAEGVAEGLARAAEIGPIARAICKSGKFETGQGGCALICMEALGDARRGCAHVEHVHRVLAGKIAEAILAASPPALKEGK